MSKQRVWRRLIDSDFGVSTKLGAVHPALWVAVPVAKDGRSWTLLEGSGVEPSAWKR